MAKLIDIKKIDDISNEKFILDTNVWLYIFSSYNTNDFGYSNILDLLLENQCSILLPPLISTEFVNRYCRQAFEVYKEEQHKFSYKKDFRPSMHYSAAFSYILGVIKEDIKPITTFVSLEETDINSALTKPCLEDLHDDVILNIASRTKSILVTHDRDYLKSNKNVKIVQL